MPAAAGGPLVTDRVTPGGNSKSWVAVKSSVIKSFDGGFRDSPAGKDFAAWGDLGADVLADKNVYELYAGFMINRLIESGKNAGKPYAVDSSTNYLSTLINMAKAKFTPGNDTTTLFFTCLDKDAKTDSAIWLKGIKTSMRRKCVQRDKNLGFSMDNSAEPLYGTAHIIPMMRAYGRAGNTVPTEAARRKLAIICGWQSAGRAGECAWITLDSMVWDPYFGQLFAEELQQKTSKMKLVGFAAGATRHQCFFLHFGDYLASAPLSCGYGGGYNGDASAARAATAPARATAARAAAGSAGRAAAARAADDVGSDHGDDSDDDGPGDAADWMLPFLRVTQCAATKVSAFIKALQRGVSGAVAYARFAVELPEGASAGGLRHGTCTELSTKMPVEFCVVATGHDMKGASALYEYLKVTRSMLQPAITVLAGFPAVPWGQLGKGPVAPSLSALGLGIDDASAMSRIVDGIFNFDSESPPTFLSRGSLRPMVEACAAALIMYYDERMRANEMRPILDHVCNTVAQEIAPGHPLHGHGIANTQLVQWGVVIRAKFVADNLHLTSRAASGGVDMMVQAVEQLSGVVQEQRALLQSLEQQLARMSLQLSLAASPASPQCAAPSPQRGATPATTAPSPQRAAPSLQHAAPSPQRARAAAVEPTTAADASAASAASATTTATAAAAAGLPLLRPPPENSPSITGLYAHQFFADCMKRGNNLPHFDLPRQKQVKSKAELCRAWYFAMATPDELKVLGPLDSALPAGEQARINAQRRRITERLDILVAARLRIAFNDASLPVPPAISKAVKGKSHMNAGSIEDRKRTLKKFMPNANAADFSKFRVTFEAGSADANGSAAKATAAKRARTEYTSVV